MRLLDYLETRTEIDSKRIGAIGFSKGGIELYLAAAADPRIAAAVPCIGVQSFGWALEHDAWRSRIASIQPAADSRHAMPVLKLSTQRLCDDFTNEWSPGFIANSTVL